MKTTKRIIAGVLSLTLVLGSFALPSAENGITLFDTAIAADAETYGDFEYAILDDGTVEITGYTGQGGDVTVPIIINERNVTRIGYRAVRLKKRSRRKSPTGRTGSSSFLLQSFTALRTLRFIRSKGLKINLTTGL